MKRYRIRHSNRVPECPLWVTSGPLTHSKKCPLSGGTFVFGLVLIFFLKTTQPAPPRETVLFDNPDDKPEYLIDSDAFKEKCLEFLSKFNLEYKHSIWANEYELEIDMQDETPVVGGKYIVLCIFNPPM